MNNINKEINFFHFGFRVEFGLYCCGFGSGSDRLKNAFAGSGWLLIQLLGSGPEKPEPSMLVW